MKEFLSRETQEEIQDKQHWLIDWSIADRAW